MNKAVVTLLIVMAFVAGGAISVLAAQPSVASAASHGRDCFAVTTWVMEGRVFNQGKKPRKMAHVPEGYEVVGGAAMNDGQYGMILLCTTSK